LELFYTFAPCASMSDDLQIRLTTNERGNAIAEERMIVNKQEYESRSDLSLNDKKNLGRSGASFLFIRCVSDDRRKRQFHLGTPAELAPYFQAASNDSGPLAHAWQSPMSLPAVARKKFRVYANAIVAYTQPKHSVGIPNVQFYMLRSSVVECVRQRFPRNALRVFAEAKLQLPRRAFYQHVERYRTAAVLRGRVNGGQFLADGGEAFHQTVSTLGAAS
jgi:hypothetical protein